MPTGIEIMNNIRQKLGKRIRILRKARGFTQEGLGEKAELSYKYVSEIERGLVNPSLDSLSSIAKVLGVDIVNLFQVDEDITYRLPDNLAYQLPLKDIKLIKQALALLNKTFSKDLQNIQDALALLNKVFSKID